MTSSNAPLVRRAPTKPGADRCRAWYDAYGRIVYRFLRFHVDSADTADDLTGETFLRVVQAGERYDPTRAEARTWLFSIARNVLRDHFRRVRVRRHVGIDAVRDLAVDAPSPEERLLRQEEIGRVLAGVQALGRADQDLLSLRYASELSLAEIAVTLGLREAAVRTRLWRAVARLRARLRAQEAE